MRRSVTFDRWVAVPIFLAAADPFTHAFTHYAGDLAADPAAGTVVLDVRAEGVVGGGPRESLFLACGVAVQSVEAGDGTPLEAAPATAMGLAGWEVRLPAPLADGEAFAVRVRAQGVPDCLEPGGAGIRRCGFGEGASWLDLSAVLPRSAAGLDHATLDLRVAVPAGEAVAASGEARPEGPPEGGLQAWRVEQDVPAFTRGLAFGTWDRGVLPTPAGPVQAFSGRDPAVRDGAPRVLARAAGAWQSFAADFGPADAPALTLAQVDGAGAALALAGMAWLPEGLWTGEGGGTIHPPDLAPLVVPHEVAHQWFPVTAAPTPLGGTWIQEGLAEWMALRALAAAEGEEAARAALRDLCRRWRLGVPPAEDRALSTVAGPANVADRERYFLLAYAKSACALRSLEAAAGPEAFRAALAGLLSDLRGTGAFFDGPMLRDRLEAAVPGGPSPWWDLLVMQAGQTEVLLTTGIEPAAPGRVRVRLDARTTRVGAPGATPGAGLRKRGAVPHLPAAVPRYTVEVRTTGEAHRVDLELLSGAATAWLELDGRFLGLAPDPDDAWPLGRARSALAGDVDLSGEVDGLDLLAAAAALDAAFPGDARYDEACDLDASGTVDEGDLQAVLAAYGAAL